MWFAGNTAVAVEAVEHTDVLRIYSAQDGELIKELRGPWSMVRTSQDGRQIVVYHRGELVIHAVEGDVPGQGRQWRDRGCCVSPGWWYRNTGEP